MLRGESSKASSKNTRLSRYDRQLYLLIILSSFPFIIPNPLISTGIQPYAIIYSTYVIIEILLSGERIRIEDSYFRGIAIATYISLFISLFSVLNAPASSIARELSAYLNVFLVPCAYCLLRMRTNIDIENLTKKIIWVWVIVGVLQITVNKELFSNLLAFHQTSESRGAFGLATEPSFYGIQLYFFLYYIKYYKAKRTEYYILVVLTALLIVRSLTSLIFIALFFVDEYMDNDKIDKLLIYNLLIGILLAVFVVLLNTALSETRLAYLLKQVFTNGISSLNSDLSTMGRVSRVTDSFSEAIENSLIPQGYLEKYGSPWGGALNHLGAFGFIYMICIPGIVAKIYNTRIGKFTAFNSILILFSTTVQMSNPMLGIILGISLSMPSEGTKALSEMPANSISGNFEEMSCKRVGDFR